MPEHHPQPESYESRLELFCERLGLKDQWEAQVKALNETGILEILPESQDIGVVGIDGKEYPIPTYQDILARITSEKMELLERKLAQGFSKLQLIPLAMPLDILIDRYKRELIKHSQTGTLLSTDNTPLELNLEDPLYVWEEYKKADSVGRLVYYPQRFDQNHQGKTKQELINQGDSWEINLVEETVDIPAQGHGQTLGGRKQLEANQSPNAFLNSILNDPQYQGEQGLTPEARLILAITHLHQTNQVIDDYQGQGKACYSVGAFFPARSLVPHGFFYRDHRQAYLHRNNPDNQNSYNGAGSSVNI